MFVKTTFHTKPDPIIHLLSPLYQSLLAENALLENNSEVDFIVLEIISCAGDWLDCSWPGNKKQCQCWKEFVINTRGEECQNCMSTWQIPNKTFDNTTHRL